MTALAARLPVTSRHTGHVCAAMVEISRINAAFRGGVIPDDVHAEAHQRLRSILRRLERAAFRGAQPLEAVEG